MRDANQEVREAKSNIPLWRIAKQLGVSEQTLIRWLRVEMDEQKKTRVLVAITEIKNEMVQQLTGKKAVQLSDIDEGMRTLVSSMNRHEWLYTVSSCEGHEGHESFPNPYVSFACHMSKLNQLCKILQQVDKEIYDSGRSACVDLSIVFSTFVNNSQDDMQDGWISLHLDIEIHDSNFEETKKYLLNRLTKLFSSERVLIGA